METKPSEHQKPWTEADDWAIKDLYGTLYRKDLAKILGRTEHATKRRILILNRRGFIGKENNLTGVSSSPWTMRKNVLLVAKTCLHCGEFLPAISFTFSGGRYAPACKLCLRNYQSDETKKERKREHDSKRNDRNKLQEISASKATRKNAEWTDWEDNKLRDITKSNFELAIELSRTYASIASRRFRLEIKKYAPDSGKWIIKNGT